MQYRYQNGFTLIELMAVIVILVFLAVYVGAGLMRLQALEEMNREKARALDKLSDVEARVQTLVTVGAKAAQNSTLRTEIVYPYMVFGIVCETNYLVQVTNTTLELPNNNTVVTTIRSGKRGGGRDRSVSMPFLDPLLPTDATRVRRWGAAPLMTNGVFLLSYGYGIEVKGRQEEVGFAVPIRMRNTAYEGYPDYDD
ncbi:MAG: type II secretion system protein [Kiritimatiellae bacterium]|nr:type II secretion system protein [Kiritimatiellia bacterium]